MLSNLSELMQKSPVIELFEEVQGGLMWSNDHEMAHNHPILLVARSSWEGSVKLNLPEPVHDVSYCLADSALELFKVVRRGSMWSNNPELAHNHPILLITPV